MNRIATLLGVSLMMTALPIAAAVAQQPATPTSPQAILVGSDSLVGSTVRELIENLDRQHPGTREQRSN